MATYTASIETVDKGTFVYGFHLGTVEWIARDCARELMHLYWTQRLGAFRVRTVGLLRDGALIDVFDGDWMSQIDAAYLDEMDIHLDEIETRLW